MDRRTFLATAPVAALPVAATAATAPDMSVLVEAVMSAVVPHRGGFVAFEAEALQALCEASGVEWAEHWAYRHRKT